MLEENEQIAGVDDLRVVARGAIATVYRGTLASSRLPVAVKVLHATLPTPEHRAHFEREVGTVAAASIHPHLATIHHVGVSQAGHPYVVVDWRPRSVADAIAAQGRLRWQEAVALGAEAASALTALHRAGVLHRDVTPGNILLAGDDVPELTDAALARYSGPKQTSGSPALAFSHAAPELIEGKHIDERADVYALASTLHEALTGNPPFARPGDDSLEPVIERILHEPAPGLQRAGVPPAVEGVILGAMAKDPSQRPASAELFAQALLTAARAAGAEERTTAMPVTAGPATGGPSAATTPIAVGSRGPQRRGRRRFAVALAAALAAALVAGVVWGVTRSDDESADQATTVPTTAEPTSTEAATTSSAPPTSAAASGAVYPFAVEFDLVAGTASVTGAAALDDAAVLREAVADLPGAQVSLVEKPGASPDGGTVVDDAAALVAVMRRTLASGTLGFDGRTFSISGQYLTEAGKGVLESAIASTRTPANRPDLTAAPPDVSIPTTVVGSTAPSTTEAGGTTTTAKATTVPAGPTTSLSVPNSGFRMTSFTVQGNSTTLTFPADGKFHEFTYDVKVAGGSAATWCPNRAGIDEIKGPGLSDLDLGKCFPVTSGSNRLRFRAFAVTTVEFDLWMCDGPSEQVYCPKADRSANSVRIRVVTTG